MRPQVHLCLFVSFEQGAGVSACTAVNVDVQQTPHTCAAERLAVDSQERNGQCMHLNMCSLLYL